jgi:hypothetical protein
MTALRAWIVLGGCALIAGCPGGSEHSAGTQTIGASLLAACDDDAQCASKLCTYGLYSVNEPGVCSKTCKSNADCTSSMGKHATCREVAAIPKLDTGEKQTTWRKACVLPCADSDPGVFECKDGVRLFCEDAAPPACSVCGCAEGSYCSTGDEQCKSYERSGEDCKDDGECLSGKCNDKTCTGGPGDVCDKRCDGTCGGPADALYCMPKCVAGAKSDSMAESRCPVRLHGWECFGDAKSDQQYCGRVCTTKKDCIADGDVCEEFPDHKNRANWPYYFTGFCHQPR